MKVPRRLSRSRTVYVDTKILRVELPDKSKRKAFVGFYIEKIGRSMVRKSEAIETDDAEADAILYAIDELRKMRFGKATIVCDHQSVVSEATKGEAHRPGEWMKKLREELKNNRWVKLRALEANLAHGVVTEYVNKVKEASST